MVQEKEQRKEEEPPLSNEAEAEAEVQPEVNDVNDVNDYLKDLCILPPSCTDNDNNTDNNHNNANVKDQQEERKQLVKDAILLPPISPTEPVSAIRGAISEIRGYAHITNYRLVLQDIDGHDDQLVDDIVLDTQRRMEVSVGVSVGVTAANAVPAANASNGNGNGNGNGGNGGGKKKKKKKVKTVPPRNVVSPYTCNQNVIQPSFSTTPTGTADNNDNDNDNNGHDNNGQGDNGNNDNNDNDDNDNGEIVFNDYDDLTLLAQSGKLTSRMGLRMVLERYNLGTVKDHVFKTRFLLDGNAPSVLGVVGTGTGAPTGTETGTGTATAAASEEESESESKEGGDDNHDNKDESNSQPTKEENGNDNGNKEKDDTQKTKTAQQQPEKKLSIDPAELKIPLFPAERVNLPTSLEDFYYLACGEEERLALVKGDPFENQPLEVNQKDAALSIGNGNGSGNANANANGDSNNVNISSSASAPDAHSLAKRFVRLEERCKVDCSIAFGGFNPPPAQRGLLGDLAYLEVGLPGGEGTVHLTVMPTGFYVNCSTGGGTGTGAGTGSSEDGSGSGSSCMVFDPSPAAQPCFSHTLLDCLLLKSPSLRNAWSEALAASLERSQLTTKYHNDPLQALFRAATHVDLVDHTGTAGTRTRADDFNKTFDSATLRPSWLVPVSRGSDGTSGTPVHSHDHNHHHNLSRSEQDMADSFGVDFRNGAARDWNEELQLAREMPRDTMEQRIERARLVHKTLCDFGDAAAAGVAGIFKGQIGPMNPNEEARSHVYLHNNIFFSRAMDSGVDTFKIARGDKCARKSASRDAVCVGMLHKLDNPGINTLATVLVDYLGTRMVCQSIVPGILLGEKTHQILYGAVEAASPLMWDKEFHEKLEHNLGKALMIASRKVPKLPLSDEKMAQIEEEKDQPSDTLAEQSEEATSCTDFFGSVELKGIRGSDCRDYCLDITRLTPRDANWVSKENGGTGNWEESNSKMSSNLNDDEWIVSVFRQELIRRFTSMKMHEFIKARNDKKPEQNEATATKDGNDADVEISRKEEDEYLMSLRVNLNVFLPHFRDIEDVDKDAFQQLKKDEDLTREIASYLWDKILPHITKDVRGTQGQIPVDGKSLTNYLHERGVNCRYLGRLATMAIGEEAADDQEEQDLVHGKIKTIQRRSMPLCWLELLECEMVARSAKHVLDGYLTENGGSAASQPSKVVAAFLSALMCSSEESAADTENRLKKEGNDSDDITQATLFDGCADSLQIRSRDEVWNDIENEVRRRFMYNLHIFNRTDANATSRVSLYSLLRRVCQRSGIRLYAKNYSIGGKGLTSPNSSFPIAALDIAAILPTLKHAANDGREGFVPCRNGADAANAYLHVLLDDAKSTYEAAHMLLNERNYSLALDYSQEATNLYQRVTETPLHAKVLKCLDLTTLILFQAQEVEMSVSNAGKALAISMQIGGFDNSDVFSSHQTFAHILLNSGRLTSSIKHMRAVLYLVQLLGGPHHVELSTLYQKIGSIYDEVGNVSVANHFFRAAISRKSNDRVLQGVLTKQLAAIYAKIGQLPGAVAMEKQTYSIFRITVGDDHEYTKNSKETLEHYMKIATERGKVFAAQEKTLKEEAAANKIADEIVASEIAEEKKKKKKKKSKSKSKKKK